MPNGISNQIKDEAEGGKRYEKDIKNNKYHAWRGDIIACANDGLQRKSSYQRGFCVSIE